MHYTDTTPLRDFAAHVKRFDAATERIAQVERHVQTLIDRQAAQEGRFSKQLADQGERRLHGDEVLLQRIVGLEQVITRMTTTMELITQTLVEGAGNVRKP